MKFYITIIFAFIIQIGSAQDVLMQGWYWDYPKTTAGESWADTITDRAIQLGEAGVTHMWLPPLSRASFGSNSNGYDPKDLYDLGEYGLGATGFGTRPKVNTTISALNAAGIKAIADVVYNHRDGGAAEQNASVEGWIENYNCTKKNSGDNPFPSDRVRLVIPIGGSTGNGATTYYIKVRSVSGHPDFHNFGYNFYAETNTVGFQNMTAQAETEPNGGGDCGQGNTPVSLGIDYLSNVDSDYNCGSGCGIDEFALTLSAADFDSAGDSIYIYLNNTGGYSDHNIIGIWNGVMDIQSQIIYQTYTDFTSLPSGQGAMDQSNFRPNGNPTTLNGDFESMLFFYDYDQSVTSTQTTLLDWTKWLNSDVGIEGLRMDAVKHFPPSFVSYLMDGLQASGQSPDMVVGEFFDTNAGALKGWTDAVNSGMNMAAQAEIDVKVFDFALRQSLKDACDLFGYDARNVFNAGIVRGASGNKNHVATFVNNHDYREENEPILNDPILPYAYILTNPEIGTPTLFYSDYYGIANANAPTDALATEIKVLIDIFKDNIQNATSVDYLSAIGSSYPIAYASGFDNTSLIFQTNDGGEFGNHSTVVAINFAGDPLSAEVTVNTSGTLSDGNIMLETTGKSAIHEVTVTSGKINIQVPPRSYAIYSTTDGGVDCNRAEILYVDLNASGQNNGSDWSNAFSNLNAALSIANQCIEVNEIRIKEGTYLPNAVMDRSQSFSINQGLTIIGGFPTAGTPALGDQDINLYPTVLDGDIGSVGDASDNTYHVIETLSISDTIKLEALILKNGNADGISSTDKIGAGISNAGNLLLKNIKVMNNSSEMTGSGIYNTGFIGLDGVTLEMNIGVNDVENATGGEIKVSSDSVVKD